MSTDSSRYLDRWYLVYTDAHAFDLATGKRARIQGQVMQLNSAPFQHQGVLPVNGVAVAVLLTMVMVRYPDGSAMNQFALERGESPPVFCVVHNAKYEGDTRADVEIIRQNPRSQ